MTVPGIRFRLHYNEQEDDEEAIGGGLSPLQCNIVFRMITSDSLWTPRIVLTIIVLTKDSLFVKGIAVKVTNQVD